MDEWENIAERKIREAMAEGAFENLSGKGKPLDLEENPYEDPSTRMAHRLLRNNGFAPAWVEEAKDLQRAIDTPEPSTNTAVAALGGRLRATRTIASRSGTEAAAAIATSTDARRETAK